ncbi:MAG: (2Fe-2S)-binding protein [Deltaproteobacteria bacterium]|nr:(2Fe-2S)-binding protein [Deltaproteobacteria bacterium]
MEPRAEINLVIDGQEVSVPEGSTILEAAQANGIRIPTLCHHPELSPYGGCRLCLVEVDQAPRLVASCVTPVRKGMNVVTSNDKIIEARRTILEFLFSERNHYCMFCAQSGDCELQNLAYEYQMDHLTVSPLGQEYPVDTSHPDLVIDHNRCVLCGRCVRACRELAGNAVLDFQNRGGRTMIGVDLAGGLGDSTCSSCGVCLQVCPTGAIFHRHRTHAAVKGQAKDWQTIESFCPDCGLLCPALYTVRDNNLLKIEGQLTSDRPDRGQLCRRGRFEALKSPGPRLVEPLVKDANGKWKRTTWDQALDRVTAELGAISQAHGGQAILGLASSRCSNEELTGFKDLMTTTWAAGYVDTLDGRHFRTIAAAEEAQTSIKEAPWGALLEADLILEVGACPAESHPLISSLTRRAILENKTKLAVIGLENPLGPWASVYLRAPDGNMPLLMAALAAGVNRSDEAQPPQELGECWAIKGFRDLVNLFKQSQNPIIVGGEGLTGLGDPSAFKQVAELARGKGLLPEGAWRLIILKPNGNSAGAWSLGVAARQGLNGRRDFKGGLVCLAGEDCLSPGPLDSVADPDFLAVLTPCFSGALAARAHVLIPKPTWLEADGTFALTDGSGSRFKVKVLEPPPGIQPAEQTLAALADRAGPPPEGGQKKIKSQAKPRSSLDRNGG